MCNITQTRVLKFVCNNPLKFVRNLMRNINGKYELEFMFNVTVNISIQNQSLHISEGGMLNMEHETTKWKNTLHIYSDKANWPGTGFHKKNLFSIQISLSK